MMFSHYLRIAFRSLLKYTGFSAINIISLTLGISAATLILIFVLDELSYDRLHTNSDRLYRVISIFDPNSQGGSSNETNAWPIGEIIRRDFAEVEAVLYAREASQLMITWEGKRMQQRSHYVSAEFFNMFSFPLLAGDAESALRDPFSVVISETMAAKYFPTQSALGKMLICNDTLPFRITGIMQDIPPQSHIQADLLFSFTTWEKISPNFSYSEGWGNFNVRNYVLLREGTQLADFEPKGRDLYTQYAGEQMKRWGIDVKVGFEPLPQIYLHSKAGNGMGPLGSLYAVNLLSGIALFVVALACINFVNLATARSVHRAKEVGIKKVVGSSRAQLISQFLSESLVVTLLALVLSIAVLGLFLPVFNMLVAKNYSMAALANPRILVGVGILLVFITLTAGYYPAWVLSAFQPSEIVKGKLHTSTRGIYLRRFLVVLQFTVSVGLVSGTFIVLDQLRFMQNRELGFTREEVLVLDLARTKPADDNAYQAFAHELSTYPTVQQVSFCNALPAISGWRGQWAYPEGKEDADHLVETHYIAADEHYLPTLGLTLLAGRNFDPARPSDEEALIINEETVRQMGWGTPEGALGQKIVSPSQYPAGTVIGVVKNYHDWGLQNKIMPLAIDFNRAYAHLYAIRFPVSETQPLLQKLAALWSAYFPENEFRYSFLTERFAREYEREKRLAFILTLFSGLTILIATIGLLGLVSFLVTAKTKEIGIRKILGASVWHLSARLSKEFLVLVLLANAAAIPAVLYLAQRWLTGFAYRTELSPLTFLLTSLVAIAITGITISFHTVKAALANPVYTLRSE